MAFDISTAKPVNGGVFDVSTAQPVDEQAEPVQQDTGLFQKANDALRPAFETFPLDVASEFISGINRAGVDALEFFTLDLINNVLELSGSDKRIPKPSESEFVQGGTKGEFMEEGIARDIVRTGGEFAGGGVIGGGAIRQASKQVPGAIGAIEQGVGGLVRNTARDLSRSTPAQDALFGALSGVGAETLGAGGEALAGERGRQVGEMVGGTLTPMLGGLRPMTSRTSNLDTSSAAASSQAQAAEQATGVKLLPGQRTLNPEMLRAQRFLPELSPATQKASQALARQNKQASDAVDEFIGMIAPDDSVVTAAGRFRTASQRAMDAAKARRSEKASPFYKQAFQEGADVDLQPVRESIRNVLVDFPETGGVAKSMKKVDSLLGDNPSLQRLHNAKLEIDDMLSKVGESSLGNTAKRELRNVKQTLVDQMELASPAYREGRLAFERASPEVNKLQDSIIGKIAGLDDTQLKSVSRKIFDPSETNPQVVRQAKQVIDEVDPDAWNRLLRAEVERRIGSIKPEVGVSFENVPSKNANAIFGTGKNREALLAGMTPQQRKHAELLETALVRAGLGRPGGSETAGRQEFVKDLDSGVMSTIRNFLRSPIDQTLSVGEGSAFDRRAKALADALFDPAWQGEAMRSLKDNSGKSFGYLLYQVNDSLENQTKKQTQSPQTQEQPTEQQ